MKYKLIIHTDLVVSRFHPRYVAAQKFLDSEVLRDSAPYVPMRSGDLMKSGNSGTIIGSGQVVYIAPYARRQYYGLDFNFSKDKHPQACAQWFEKAKATKLSVWTNDVQKIIKG